MNQIEKICVFFPISKGCISKGWDSSWRHSAQNGILFDNNVSCTMYFWLFFGCLSCVAVLIKRQIIMALRSRAVPPREWTDPPMEGQLMAWNSFVIGRLSVFFGKIVSSFRRNNPVVCGLGKRSTWLTGRTQGKQQTLYFWTDPPHVMRIYTFGFAFTFGLCRFLRFDH